MYSCNIFSTFIIWTSANRGASSNKKILQNNVVFPSIEHTLWKLMLHFEFGRCVLKSSKFVKTGVRSLSKLLKLRNMRLHLEIIYTNRLTLLDPVRRNRFLISRLTTMVSIGLWRPYAKLESGTNLVMYDVLLIHYVVVVYSIEIPGIHFQDQNTKQKSNNNWKINLNVIIQWDAQ